MINIYTPLSANFVFKIELSFFLVIISSKRIKVPGQNSNHHPPGPIHVALDHMATVPNQPQMSIFMQVGKWVFILVKVAIWQLVMALMQHSKWRKKRTRHQPAKRQIKNFKKILECHALSIHLCSTQIEKCWYTQ